MIYWYCLRKHIDVLPFVSFSIISFFAVHFYVLGKTPISSRKPLMQTVRESTLGNYQLIIFCFYLFRFAFIWFSILKGKSPDSLHKLFAIGLRGLGKLWIPQFSQPLAAHYSIVHTDSQTLCFSKFLYFGILYFCFIFCLILGKTPDSQHGSTAFLAILTSFPLV